MAPAATPPTPSHTLSSPSQTLPILGPLMGDPLRSMLILRNANVACLCRLFKPMSHVEFKKQPCRMSLYCLKPCRMSMSSMSHVEFQKWQCRHVEFRGSRAILYIRTAAQFPYATVTQPSRQYAPLRPTGGSHVVGQDCHGDRHWIN